MGRILSVPDLADALGLSVLKLLTCAAITWGIDRAFGVTDTAFGVRVLQMAPPVAVTVYLLAARNEADAQTVAGLVAASTLPAVPGLSLKRFDLNLRQDQVETPRNI